MHIKRIVFWRRGGCEFNTVTDDMIVYSHNKNNTMNCNGMTLQFCRSVSVDDNGTHEDVCLALWALLLRCTHIDSVSIWLAGSTKRVWGNNLFLQKNDGKVKSKVIVCM